MIELRRTFGPHLPKLEAERLGLTASDQTEADGSSKSENNVFDAVKSSLGGEAEQEEQQSPLSIIPADNGGYIVQHYFDSWSDVLAHLKIDIEKQVLRKEDGM